MVRRRRSRETSVEDFRHAQAQRKNNPPAGIAPTYERKGHYGKSKTGYGRSNSNQAACGSLGG